MTFRANRSTIWSLTRDATALSVHAAYAWASPEVMDAFATIARQRGRRTTSVREARRVVHDWPGLAPALEVAREAHASRRRDGAGLLTPTRCAGSPEQRAYVRAVYRYLNHTRFSDVLPSDIPIRLSARMTSTLGCMMPAQGESPHPRVGEIVLNIHLLTEANAVLRVDTLLHEMAHAADYLTDGNLNHGRAWRAWARRVGCRPSARCDVEADVSGGTVVDRARVPPLPPTLRVALDLEADGVS